MRNTKVIEKSYKELNEVSRYQLLNYPRYSFKQYIKISIKSLLKRENILYGTNYFWPNGLLATSLEWCHRKNKNSADLKVLKKYYDNWIKKGTPIKNSDYIINGYSLIYLYSINKDEKYLNAIKNLIYYVKNIKKTKENSIPYRENKPTRVLIDSLGMVCPFLCRYGVTFNDEASIDLATVQLMNFLIYGMDKDSGLPYHGYDMEENVKLGIVGWGRAIGWLLIGLVDSLEYIPESHHSYDFLKKNFQKTVENVIKCQDKEGNFSWQITLKEGYNDTSSTSMITYAIKRGMMLNLLSASYSKNVELALDALLSYINNGRVDYCSAECRGIGMYPQIYGNYPWAQGPTTSLFAISKNKMEM